MIGAGAWGTALSTCLAAAGRTVSLVARDPALADRIVRERINPAYLPGVPLHPAIRATADLEEGLAGVTVVVLAVPTRGLADMAARIGPPLPADTPVVSAAKGFDHGSGATMTVRLREVLGPDRPVAALSGPNIAIEVARGLLAASVIGSDDATTAARCRDALSNPRFRCYSNADVVGVEYGGALKNVVAIAAGICDGIGGGDNAKAAIVTRGLAEMTRLGVAAGAQAATFAGLAGLGDVTVTCSSPHSRNRRLGEEIGRGRTLAEIEAGLFQAVEGIAATRAARRLGAELGVATPIVDAVHAVLFGGMPVVDAITALMAREPRPEV